MGQCAITAYFHCAKCMREKPAGVSAQNWSWISVGLTKDGHIQAWCNRHEMNIVTTEDEVRMLPGGAIH